MKSISHLLVNHEEYQFEGGKKKRKQVVEDTESDEEPKQSGFECIPKVYREVEGNEPKKIRTVLIAMLIAHFVFLGCELFLYPILSLIFSDIFYAWLCYYCYQTMNTCALYLYMVVLGLGCILGVMQLLSVGGWFLIYLGQLACYGYAAYNLFERI